MQQGKLIPAPWRQHRETKSPHNQGPHQYSVAFLLPCCISFPVMAPVLAYSQKHTLRYVSLFFFWWLSSLNFNILTPLCIAWCMPPKRTLLTASVVSTSHHCLPFSCQVTRCFKLSWAYSTPCSSLRPKVHGSLHRIEGKLLLLFQHRHFQTCLAGIPLLAAGTERTATALSPAMGSMGCTEAGHKILLTHPFIAVLNSFLTTTWNTRSLSNTLPLVSVSSLRPVSISSCCVVRASAVSCHSCTKHQVYTRELFHINSCSATWWNSLCTHLHTSRTGHSLCHTFTYKALEWFCTTNNMWVDLGITSTGKSCVWKEFTSMELLAGRWDVCQASSNLTLSSLSKIQAAQEGVIWTNSSDLEEQIQGSILHHIPRKRLAKVAFCWLLMGTTIRGIPLKILQPKSKLRWINAIL